MPRTFHPCHLSHHTSLSQNMFNLFLVTWQNLSPMTLPILKSRLRAIMMKTKVPDGSNPISWSSLIKMDSNPIQARKANETEKCKKILRQNDSSLVKKLKSFKITLKIDFCLVKIVTTISCLRIWIKANVCFIVQNELWQMQNRDLNSKRLGNTLINSFLIVLTLPRKKTEESIYYYFSRVSV